MKAKGWIVSLIVVGGLGMGVRSACTGSPAPDERFVAHLDDMCEIARKNVETPVKGVKKLGIYLVRNLGGITGSFGDTIAVIERIRDDDKHDARARLARDRIHSSTLQCQDTWARFVDAVDASEEASQLVTDGLDRFMRTIEILLGPGFRMRDLPARLDALLAP